MKVIQLTATDGSLWNIPVDVIAQDRAKHYAHEYGGDVQRSMEEDTGPLFAQSRYEILDWAENNMNWPEVAHAAYKVADAPPLDLSESWVQGKKEVIEVKVPFVLALVKA